MQANHETSRQNLRISGEDIVFLTNGGCEETGQVSEQRLEELGLQYGEFDGSPYPLTDHESNFIGEDVVDIGGFSALLGYSVLFEGAKYLAPTIEIDYFESNDDANTYPAAQELNLKLGQVASKLAELTGGRYCWENNPAIEFAEGDGKFVAELMIPIDYAEAHAQDFESWKQHLTELGQKAHTLITS
jgi:hypothetical protein